VSFHNGLQVFQSTLPAETIQYKFTIFFLVDSHLQCIAFILKVANVAVVLSTHIVYKFIINCDLEFLNVYLLACFVYLAFIKTNHFYLSHLVLALLVYDYFHIELFLNIFNVRSTATYNQTDKFLIDSYFSFKSLFSFIRVSCWPSTYSWSLLHFLFGKSIHFNDLFL